MRDGFEQEPHIDFPDMASQWSTDGIDDSDFVIDMRTGKADNISTGGLGFQNVQEYLKKYSPGGSGSVPAGSFEQATGSNWIPSGQQVGGVISAVGQAVLSRQQQEMMKQQGQALPQYGQYQPAIPMPLAPNTIPVNKWLVAGMLVVLGGAAAYGAYRYFKRKRNR